MALARADPHDRQPSSSRGSLHRALVAPNFERHVGVGPKWIIRRSRVVLKPPSASHRQPGRSAALAQELGFTINRIIRIGDQWPPAPGRARCKCAAARAGLGSPKWPRTASSSTPSAWRASSHPPLRVSFFCQHFHGDCADPGIQSALLAHTCWPTHWHGCKAVDRQFDEARVARAKRCAKRARKIAPRPASAALAVDQERPDAEGRSKIWNQARQRGVRLQRVERWCPGGSTSGVGGALKRAA